MHLVLTVTYLLIIVSVNRLLSNVKNKVKLELIQLRTRTVCVCVFTYAHRKSFIHHTNGSTAIHRINNLN